MDLSTFGIGELTGMAAALMAFTVWIVSQIKRFFCWVPWKWTAKIPSFIWIVLSVAIPVGVCVALNIDWFQALSGRVIPDQFKEWSGAATGVIVGISAQGSFKLTQIGKAAIAAKGIAVPKTYTPGGPNDTSSPEYCPPVKVPCTPEVIPEVPAVQDVTPVVAPVVVTSDVVAEPSLDAPILEPNAMMARMAKYVENDTDFVVLNTDPKSVVPIEKQTLSFGADSKEVW